MKKSLIILVSILSIIIVLISIVLVNIDSLLEKYIKEELDQIIKSSENKIYEFKYKNVDFNVWNGSFELTDVDIRPKQGMTDSLRNGNIRSLISAKFNNLSIVSLLFFNPRLG